MTQFEFRELITDIMGETLPKVNKRDRENFLDLLFQEIDGQLEFDDNKVEADDDSLFDSYGD